MILKWEFGNCPRGAFSLPKAFSRRDSYGVLEEGIPLGGDVLGFIKLRFDIYLNFGICFL